MGISLILFFYLLMIVSSAVCSGFALEYRHKSIVRIFLYSQAAFIIWCLFNLLVFFTNPFELKVYFANLRFIGSSLLTPFWMIFCSELFDHKFILRNKKYLFIIPCFIIYIAINPKINYLLLTNFKIIDVVGIQTLYWSGGPLLNIHLFYAYFLLIYVFYICFRGIKKEGPYKGKNAIFIITLIIIFLIPELLGFLYFPELRFLGINVLSQAVSGIMLFYILHRVQLVRSFSSTKDNLFETIPSSIIVLNKNGYLSLYNQIAGKEFNLTFNDIGKNFTDILPLNLQVKIRSVLDTIIRTNESNITISNGSAQKYYKVITHSFFHQSLDGEGLIIALEDITRLKEIENELTEKNQNLAAVNEALVVVTKTERKLLSLISHDVVGNLSSIQLLSLVMVDDLTKYDSQTIEYNLTLLADYAEQTLSLTSEVLLWATHNNSQNTLKKKVNFSSVILKTIEQLMPVSSRKKIKIITEINNPLEDFYAEEKMIYVIVRNILANALKFSIENSDIYIRLEYSKSKIVFTVIDSGVGLQDSMTFEANKGFGLGLQFTKEFIAFHNGEFTLDNNDPTGTKVTASFPLSV